LLSGLVNIYNLYKDDKANAFIKRALKEDIRREVVFNRLLLNEIKRLSRRKKKPLENFISLQLELKVEGLEKVINSGLPLNELFSGIEVAHLRDSNFSPYIKRVIGKKLEHSDLIEKLYARLIIAKSLATHNVEKDVRSINNNIQLLNLVLDVIFL
jgi:hypothetical protein